MNYLNGCGALVIDLGLRTHNAPPSPIPSPDTPVDATVLERLITDDADDRLPVDLESCRDLVKTVDGLDHLLAMGGRAIYGADKHSPYVANQRYTRLCALLNMIAVLDTPPAVVDTWLRRYLFDSRSTKLGRAWLVRRLLVAGTNPPPRLSVAGKSPCSVLRSWSMADRLALADVLGNRLTPEEEAELRTCALCM